MANLYFLITYPLLQKTMDFFRNLFLFKQPAQRKETVMDELEIPKISMPPLPDHMHQWEMAMKTYAPAQKSLAQEALKAGSVDLVQKMIFGLTVLLWKCVVCSESKQEEIIGSDENQLDEVFNKVDLYGPQYIQKEGVTFIIAKWQPTPASTSVLPLR